MNRKRILMCIACAALPLALNSRLSAQEQPASPPPASVDATTREEETIELSPFVVTSDEDEGYDAKYTLAGTRIRTDIKDVGSSITVVTSKFLSDTGSTNATQLLVYTPNTEVAGQGGNFLGAGDAQYAGNVSYGQNRVRGLSNADNTRDFFLTDILWDSYNTGRIDIQRGANSILFGIGSPAGIVNASLNHAMYKNARKVENKVDNFGTVRFTGDFNQVLIPNQLAIRISLLDDNTKYRQEPAFRHDKRFFITGRWDPDFLNRGIMKTSFEAGFEKGKIEANLFRPTPPIDYMTPWFLLPADRKANGFTYMLGTGADADPAGFFIGGAADQLTQGGVIMAYSQNQPQGIAFEHSSAGGNALVGGAFFRGILSKAEAYNRAKGKILGANANAWKSTYITDRSVFDSYEKLLDGDTKRENQDFDALNLAFRQSFWDDTLGYELAYDKQNSHSFGHHYLGQAGYGIAVDIMSTLEGGTNAGVVFDDGSTSVFTPAPVNPNFGKAYVVGARGSGWDWSRSERETMRGTAYYNLDLPKLLGADSKIAQLFGVNRFTGLASSYEQTGSNGNSSDYNMDASSRAAFTEDNTYIMHFLSNTKTPNDTPAGLNLPALSGYPVLSAQQTLTFNDATHRYITRPFGLEEQWTRGEEDRDYLSGPGKSRRTVDTAAVVWQGYWFGGNIIPLAAYRKDTSFFNPGGVYDGSDFEAGAPSTTVAGTQFYHPFDPGYVLGPDSPKSRVTSRTYGVVTHTPKFLRNKLPGNIDVQLIYNQSENFEPSPGRTDIMNRPIPDPSGRTKEYGFAISALNDKLYLKVVKYKTNQENTELGDFNSGNISSVAAAEVWARSAAYGHAGLRPSGIGPTATGPWDFQIDRIYGYSSDGHAVTFKPYGPWALNKEVIGGLPGSSGGGLTTTWAGLLPGETAPAGSTRLNYTQAEIDATWTRQKAAFEAVLNSPPTDDFLIANGIDKATFYNPELGMFDYGGGAASAVVTGSTESEGTEFELVASPMKGLTVLVNATRTRAKRTSIAQSFLDYVDARRPFWYGPAGDLRIWGSGEADNALDPYTQNFNASMSVAFKDQVDGPISKFLAATDSYVPELHPWAFNIIGNYEFQADFLRGVHVGGGYRWQDKLVTGYPITTDEFGNEVYDLANPYYGPTQAAVDLWAGYQRKLGRKFKWHVQLNVRNAFANDKLIKSQSNPDGTGAAYRIAEPRTFTLTNTIEF